MNLQGVKISAWFSEFCGIAGVIFPLALVIILGGIWFFTGQPLAIDFSTNKLWPDMLDPNYWTSLTFVVFGLTGIEIATAHAHDVQNPARVYPIALFLSVFIIVTCTLLGSLSIAITIPQQKLNVVSGIMQAIEQFFTVFHLRALLPIVALSIIVGSLGSINNWIISPSRGLVVALRDENLAPSLQLPNKHGAPAKLLIYQAVLVTLLSCIFVLMPSIKSSYWILTVLASQAYMLMYLIVFAAAIYLRYKQPDKARPFKIPGGKLGIWLVAGTGFSTSSLVLLIGFYPPSWIDIEMNYQLLILGSLVLLACPPFALYWYHQLKLSRMNSELMRS